MTTIYVKAADQTLTGTRMPTVACNNRNSVKLHAEFDSSWDGYAKSAVFFTSKDSTPYEAVLSVDGNCLVPAEVLVEEARLYIGLKGVNSASGGIKTSALISYKVLAGTPSMVISDPSPTVYEQIIAVNEDTARAISSVQKQINQIVAVPSESTEGNMELVNIRFGADGKYYDMAGNAVRQQFAAKANVQDYAFIDYERGNVGITAAGWNYDDQYTQTMRVRIKEGYEVRLKTGDVIGLKDYSNARYYFGYRNLDGEYIDLKTGWLTEDYTVVGEGDYIMLVARPDGMEAELSEEEVEALGSLMFMRRVDGAVNQAAHHSAIISAALEADLGFILGGLDTTTGGLIQYTSRYVTKDIQRFDFDILLPNLPNNRMAVYTYTDSAGSNFKDLGWLTDTTDYIIKAGTYFRILVMTEDYETQNATNIDPDKQYESDLYKSIEVYPVVGKKINLMRTARTLARIAASEAQKKVIKRIPTPPKMRSINHRGWNSVAPENTLPAYRMSKTNGFDFVECDVRWTSDNMPVLLHDATINRTAREVDGSEIAETTNIKDIPYDIALTYDFGIYRGEEFAGTKIPTFEEFIALCRNIQLHPYIEIEDEIFAWQAKILMDIVRKYGMEEHVTWISFTHNSLLRIIEENPRARVGYLILASSWNVDNLLSLAGMLKTEYNEAFVNIDYTSAYLSEFAEKAYALNIPLEVWCPNTAEQILALPVYVSGVTTDLLIASEVLADAHNPKKVVVDDTADMISKNSKRIANLENCGMTGTALDDSKAYIKTVPENALPYAEIVTLGGTTVGDEGGVVTEIRTIGANLFNIDAPDVMRGRRIATSTGGMYVEVGYSVSGYTQIEGGKSYTLSGLSGVSYVSFYNSSNVHLSSTSCMNGKNVAAPLHAQYIRFDFADTDKPMLNEGTTALEYREYTGDSLLISEEILALEGYGHHDPLSGRCNYIDFKNRKFVAYGYCEGGAFVEYDTVKETDISKMLSADNMIHVESGGKIIFVNEANLAVPSKIKYHTSL